MIPRDVVRSFFAVTLSEEARAAAAQLARRLREADGGQGVRWVRPEGYHLTLRFLGNVARQEIAGLAQAVAEQVAPLAPFPVHLGTARVFPSPRSPRVIALAVEPEADLTRLAKRVERAVVSSGLPAERRRFRAHLTLGRVRNRRFPSVAEEPAPDCPAFAVEEIVLFQSELLPSGAVYTPLERIALRGPRVGEGAGRTEEANQPGASQRSPAAPDSP
jgi:2'-5' RNA ligase